MDSDTDDGSDAALDRVRSDLAELGADASSAPEVPPEVTARIVAAVRADRAAHSLRRPRMRRQQVLGLVVGIGATVVAVLIGATMLARGPASTYPRGPTAQQITVSWPVAGIALSDAEILAMLSVPPDYGALSAPHRLASCLDGLGYPPQTTPLGGRPIDMAGTAAVMLLLPGRTATDVAVKVVDPNCNAAHTGLLANRTVTRP
jgi:hypothetical protein